MIFSALLSRTIQSWVGNGISEFSLFVAQRRPLKDWCELAIVCLVLFLVRLSYVRLCVTSEMHSDQLAVRLL